jgi:hypothetical protein
MCEIESDLLSRGLMEKKCSSIKICLRMLLHSGVQGHRGISGSQPLIVKVGPNQTLPLGDFQSRERRKVIKPHSLSIRKNVNNSKRGHQWVTPVILATQEAEIRRIAVRSQPRQRVHETLSLKKKSTTKKD